MDSTSPPKAKLKPNITGVQETLLGILYSRALDAKSPRPVLNDQLAAEIVDRLDYDFGPMRITRSKAAGFALRGKHLDRWTAEFLDQTRGEKVTVLHLAAGLDTRAHRLQEKCGPGVTWVDADLPDVVELRRELVPEPTGMAARVRGGDGGGGGGGGYELVDADVTDDKWLANLQLPRRQRAIVVFEGLSMYLQPELGRALIEQLTSYFVGEGNQMVFDCLSSFVLRVQWAEKITASTGARFVWGIDDPRELETYHDGLRFKDSVSLLLEFISNKDTPVWTRWTLWVVSWLPFTRNAIKSIRFEW